MPSEYSMATLPKPNNQAVQLREVPPQRFAVLRYSGLNNESKVEDKTKELLAWVKLKNWQAVGSPQLSRYDPPWTLPMWRRNEIRVEVIVP
jgi:DNA gyrase inhibitor GyrI